TATVTSASSDPETANNTVTTTATVVPPVVGLADLTVTVEDAPDPVSAGSSLVYTIVVTNDGPNRATGVTLIDRLPAGVTLVSAVPTTGNCLGTSTVTCALGPLENGASVAVVITVIPDTPGTITNTVEGFAPETDPVPANNSAAVTTTVL
ncbi:MAG: DUF11 domain-containing protein, partial [Candidatus Tectomicrobia bacterium]|nr:DUF11 domain-containing protein [Candidatus Tectomicrobia bacterium]